MTLRITKQQDVWVGVKGEGLNATKNNARADLITPHGAFKATALQNSLKP
jgi:hypothetical protein